MLRCDVLVVGSTAAGACAATAAAELGAHVVLLDPRSHIEGMTWGGLGYTDIGDFRVIRGMAARFRQAVADHRRAKECDNLIDPVCASAPHVAFSSTRTGPHYQMLGHAATVPAALSCQMGVATSGLPAEQLRRVLHTQGQVTVV